MGVMELASAASPMLQGGVVLGTPLAALTAWLAHKRASRKQTDDISIAAVKEFQSIIDLQTQRITALEDQAVSERRACSAEIAELRASQRAGEAEASLREGRLMHELKNREHELDGLMLLIEVAPERAPEGVARIKARRAAKEAGNV